jgi:hypothetical protein
MRKRVQIALAVLLLVVVGVIAWQVLRSSEPVYQGRPLSGWLDQWEKSSLFPGSEARNQAQAAIRQIGTNALPLFLEWAAAHDSILKKKVMALAKRQSLIKVHLRSEEDYHARSDAGFSALGPMAKPAVPALIDLLSHEDDQVRVAAAFDLMWIGPEAQESVPALAKCLSSTNSWILRFRATRCLAHIHMRPEMAVPGLVQNLGQSGVPERETIGALVAFGAQAKPAVPKLLGLLEDKNPITRSSAVQALKLIDPEAAAKAGVR